MAEDELTTLHIASTHFKGRDRLEAFGEIYGRQIMKLEIDPLPDHPFELDFMVRDFPGFGIASGRLSDIRSR